MELTAKNIIQLLTSLMSCLIIKSYLEDFFAKRTLRYSLNLLWFLYFLLSLYCEKNNNITLSKLFIGMLAVFVISLVAYEGKVQKKLAMIILYHFIWIAIQMILGYTVMGIIDLKDYGNYELLCSVISKIVMIALVKIIPLFFDPTIECNISNRYCIMLIVLPLISIVVVYNLFLITSKIDRQELIAFSTVSSLLILFLNLLVYDIYTKLIEQTDKMRKNAIYEKLILMFQEQMNEKEELMLKNQIIKRNFDHQLSFIKELIYKKELAQLNEFIDDMIRNNNIEKGCFCNTGNVLLDYIINSKCAIAQKNDIQCNANIEVPYKFPFLDGDIYIIVGNALENAIEGTLKRQHGRKININIVYRKGNLFIKITNSYAGDIKRNWHGRLISTKPEPINHGLGLASIEKAVSKYNGLLNIDTGEEEFTLTVLLYS